jgi:hypothetical protein
MKLLFRSLGMVERFGRDTRVWRRLCAAEYRTFDSDMGKHAVGALQWPAASASGAASLTPMVNCAADSVSIASVLAPI